MRFLVSRFLLHKPQRQIYESPEPDLFALRSLMEFKRLKIKNIKKDITEEKYKKYFYPFFTSVIEQCTFALCSLR
jgi:hypothetical protein